MTPASSPAPAASPPPSPAPASGPPPRRPPPSAPTTRPTCSTPPGRPAPPRASWSPTAAPTPTARTPSSCSPPPPPTGSRRSPTPPSTPPSSTPSPPCWPAPPSSARRARRSPTRTPSPPCSATSTSPCPTCPPPSSPCPPGQHAPPPIGTALPDHRAYVLDARLRPAPPGVPGQLYIAGAGLAHGYLNRPALTAERFPADPFADTPGERMYATGDLVRRRPDGILDYLGRTDRQVKLRGQRVELGEIEHALTQHPAIAQAVVQVHGNAQLTAYLITRPGTPDPEPAALREHLADRLPTYMIPARYLTLPELPLTPNGKIDTARLPDPAPQAADYQPPHTPTQHWLAAEWASLLGIDRAGTSDNFFELGGNSLHATQLIARIADHHHIQLNPRQLFTSPVLEHLATLIDHAISQRDGEPAGTTTGTLTSADSDAGLVAFRSAGTRPPLFLVHPVGGSVTCYAQLAQALGDDQPVYAIEDPALRGEPSPEDLAVRAGRYVEQIRTQQPDGPYLVGGWSVGGLIAHEMARQLAQTGADVALFALDTDTPPERRIPTDLEVLAEFVIDLAG